MTLSGTAQFGVPFVGAVNPGGRILPSAGSSFDLTVVGANLTASSLVSLSGTRLSTIKNGSALRATVPAGLIISAGSRVITVTNPGTVVSNSVLFPVPSAASTAPQFVDAGVTNLIAPANGFNLTTADLNHDGKQDLIVCSPPVILVYLANGDGTYTAGQVIQPQAVAVFNPYQPSQLSVVGALPYATLVGDMNDDGIPDLRP